MPRPSLAAALAAAVIALASACSGADAPPTPAAEGRATSVGPSPSTASPAPPAAAITETAAAEAAELINVSQDDLPAFTRSPAPALDPQVERLTAEFVSCLSGVKPVFDLPSDTFSNGDALVSSSVAVFADAEAVRRDLAALGSDAAPGCVGTYVQGLLGVVGEVTVERLSPSAPGADGAYGFDVTTTDGGETMTLQVLGFGTGRSEVSLFAFGDLAPPQRDELFAGLVERGRTHAP